MKQRYYLYLDESGDFTHDKENKRKKDWSPSLIGGILLKNTIPSIKINNMFSGKISHSKDETVEEVFRKFELVDELNPKYVIFSNEECIKVINNNLTYQNIMAEGIIQLLTKLKSEDNEIYVDIYIAERIIIGDDKEKQKGKKYDKVDLGTYMNRIKERLIMAGNRAGIQSSEWNITLGNAVKDDMLKMADVVCNTYLTRETKFKDDKYKRIREAYKNPERTYFFTVFQSSIIRLFQEAMADGRIGEAITLICQHEDETLIKKHMENVKKRLQAVSLEDLEVQYKYISALVEHFIKVERKFEKSIRFLHNLLDYFIPIFDDIEKSKVTVLQFKLDLYFHLLTVYTHNGDVEKSIECEKICDELFHNTSFSMEMVDYQVRYKNRKIINKINQFAFDEAKQECEELIKQCKNVKEILELMTEQDFTYEELGKAYSNMVQIYSFMLRHNKKLYKEAVEISNCAIQEMRFNLRQYQYRTMLETENGNFDKAFLALAVAAGVLMPADVDLNTGTIIKKEKEIKQLCKEIANNISCEKEVYLVSNYIRLMAEGKITGWEFAEKMFEYYNLSAMCKELSGEIEEYQHPYEIIYWKLATYYAESGKWNAANDNYSKALQVCLRNKNEITLRQIGFAIELEQYAYALKCGEKVAKKIKSSLKKHYEEWKQDICLDSMKKLFEDFDDSTEEWKVYYDMSRRVTY